jgi:hypothetical protein
MTAIQTTVGKTETDLEARANAALQAAMPWLDVSTIKHQLTFSIQLGHSPIKIDGRAASKRRGRLDILIEKGSQRLAILELKKPGQPLDADDVAQGLSYARVLHPRPPIVVVSNGTDTHCYNTHTGDLLNGGLPGEADFAGLMAAALKIADSDLRDAIATLLGPDSDVWMTAVRAATRQTLDELTGEWNDPYTPFTAGYDLPRKATVVALDALRGTRRVIAIEGAPLIGKSHVVRAIALSAESAEDMAVLFVEASGTAAIGIADEVGRLLGDAIGWRISADEARHWMRKLSKSDGPTLVIAIDALGLEHETIRRELETLSAQNMGPRLKFVIEADTSVIDRLWFGESRRKETPFARRGVRIEVDELDDEEFDCALRVLNTCGVNFMNGAKKADEFRQPWVLRAMAADVIDDPMMQQGMSAVLPPLLSIGLIHRARKRFVNDPLIEQAATFARAALDDHARDDRPADVRLRSLHTFMVRKQTMRGHADIADIAFMERSGLIGTVLDEKNRAVFTGRIPELIASELSLQIAAELADRMGDDEQDCDAANWLVGITARLPFGDVIGAASLFDLLRLQIETPGLSLPFMNQLLNRSPSIRPLKPGTRSVIWVPSVGRLDMLVRPDGVTVVKRPGHVGRVELDPSEGSVTYADLDAWLILSHLASQPIRVLNLEHEEIVGLFEPAILALVGTSPVPLRRASNNQERSGLHTHDGPNGASLTCRDDGIVEPVTFSILCFLARHQENADDWLQEACDEKAAPLLNRISHALYQLAAINPGQPKAKWARGWLSKSVNPALKEALSTSND